MTRSRVFIEPFSQLRFASLAVIGAVLAFALACVVAWLGIVGPVSRSLDRAGREAARASASVTAVIELAANPSLPPDQRASLVVARAGDLASHVREASWAIDRGATRMADATRWAAVLVIALVAAALWGLRWSRHMAEAEVAIVRGLEAIVDGDLRLESAPSPLSHLFIVQRGMRRALDELRSVTRRDVQLMGEVSESVQRICTSVASDPGLGASARDQLLAAAAKIAELERIASRIRW